VQSGDVQADPMILPPFHRRWWVVASAVASMAALIVAIRLDPQARADALAPAAGDLRDRVVAGGELLRMLLPLCAVGLIGVAVGLARTTAPVPRETGVRSDRFAAALLLILLAGLVARLPRLGEGLWYDEITAWRDYGAHGPRVIIGTYHDPANHVLHTLCTWFSVDRLAFLGLTDEVALRLPALVFSLVAIAAAAMLGKRVAGAATGLVAGALVAIAPVAILEGTDARGYSAMMAVGVGATALLLEATRRGGGWWLSYALVCAAGCWVHPVTACVPLGHGLWLVARLLRGDRAGAAPGLVSLALAALVTLVAYAPIVPQILALRSTLSVTSADQPTLVGIEGIKMLEQLGGVWWWPAALPGLMLLMLGFVLCVRDPLKRSLVTAGFAGTGVFILLVVMLDSWCYARFLLFCVPVALTIAAVGLVHLWRTQRLTAAFVAALFVAGSATDLVRRPPRQPLRDAVDHLHATGDASRSGVAIGLLHQALDVYAADLDLTWSLHHGRDLPERIEAIDPAWAIMLYPRSVEPVVYEALAAQGLEQTARLPGWIDWNGNGDVLVFRRRTGE
jgi:hypothetical protein